MTTEMAQRVLNIAAAFILAVTLIFGAAPVSAATVSASEITSPVKLDAGESVEITIRSKAEGYPITRYTVGLTADGSSISVKREDCLGASEKTCTWSQDNYYPRFVNFCSPWSYWGNDLCLNVHLNPQIRAYRPQGTKLLLVTFPQNAEVKRK